MFKVDRIFSVLNQNTGAIEWYFQAREGNSGPFQSRQHAELVLEHFVKTCVESGDTGGRSLGNARTPVQKFSASLLSY